MKGRVERLTGQAHATFSLLRYFSSNCHRFLPGISLSSYKYNRRLDFHHSRIIITRYWDQIELGDIYSGSKVWWGRDLQFVLGPNSNKGPGWRWWGQAQSWIDWLKAGCILAFDSVHFGCLIWDRCVFKHLAMGKVHGRLFRCFAPPPLSLLYNTIHTILRRHHYLSAGWDTDKDILWAPSKDWQSNN